MNPYHSIVVGEYDEFKNWWNFGALECHTATEAFANYKPLATLSVHNWHPDCEPFAQVQFICVQIGYELCACTLSAHLYTQFLSVLCTPYVCTYVKSYEHARCV